MASLGGFRNQRGKTLLADALGRRILNGLVHATAGRQYQTRT